MCSWRQTQRVQDWPSDLQGCWITCRRQRPAALQRGGLLLAEMWGTAPVGSDKGATLCSMRPEECPSHGSVTSAWRLRRRVRPPSHMFPLREGGVALCRTAQTPLTRRLRTVGAWTISLVNANILDCNVFVRGACHGCFHLWGMWLSQPVAERERMMYLEISIMTRCFENTRSGSELLIKFIHICRKHELRCKILYNTDYTYKYIYIHIYIYMHKYIGIYIHKYP